MACPLLTVAAELRNIIFTEVFEDIGMIQIGENGQISNQPAMLAVCHQIRNEALPMFWHLVPFEATRIAFLVHNFDFGGFMAYYDTLSTEQRKALNQRNTLRISITLTEDDQAAQKRELARWLRFSGANFSGSTTYSLRELHAYRVVGDVPDRDQSWEEDLATVFATIDKSSYRA